MQVRVWPCHRLGPNCMVTLLPLLVHKQQSLEVRKRQRQQNLLKHFATIFFRLNWWAKTQAMLCPGELYVKTRCLKLHIGVSVYPSQLRLLTTHWNTACNSQHAQTSKPTHHQHPHFTNISTRRLGKPLFAAVAAWIFVASPAYPPWEWRRKRRGEFE